MPLPHDPYAPSDPFSVDASGKTKESAPEEPAPPAVPKGTSSELLDWVGDDRDRAARALAAENETSKPRKGLVEELQAILDEPADAPVVEAEDNAKK